MAAGNFEEKLPAEHLKEIARNHGIENLLSKEFAEVLDARCPLRKMRGKFKIPIVRDVASKSHDPDASIKSNTTEKSSDMVQKSSILSAEDECVYLCGNSLGLLPKHTERLLKQELEVWGEFGVHGHFNHKYDRPWVNIDDLVKESCSKIVGAKRNEISVLNTLTVNLHLAMISFYRPSKERFKIIMEDHSFPSDNYAIESQIRFHGYSIDDALVLIKPREGESILRHADIIETIMKHGDQTSLVMLSGVQYYTGQLFDMQSITSAAHNKGCKVGFDLAHAVGNVQLSLHEWGVDFAVWCSYKYLNSGPGGIAGLYVHENFAKDQDLPRLLGWWGNKDETRFQMNDSFDPIVGTDIYRMSNPCVFAVISLYGSLQLFNETSMIELNEKTFLLTGYLEFLLNSVFNLDSQEAPFRIMTPNDPKQRGCQLSLMFTENIKMVAKFLMSSGVVCDERKPNGIRIAPVPMYNSYSDVWKFVRILEEALKVNK